MAQSRLQSLIEIKVGTAIGFVGSWAISWAVLAYMKADNATLATVTTVACTVWSVARGYCVRRYFERRSS